MSRVANGTSPVIKSRTTTTLELDGGRNIAHAYTSQYQSFDAQGRLTSEIVYTPSGKAERKMLHTYSEAGCLVEQTVFVGHDQLLERTDHFFDDDGHLIRTEATQANGEKSIKEFHYDPVENIKKAVLNSANGEIKGYEIMWYGSENEVIAEVKTDTDNRTAYKRFATYDGAGRLVMEDIFGYDEEFEKRTMYTYAPGGVLTAITTTGPQRRKLSTEKLTYNPQGQLVERLATNHTEQTTIRFCYRYNAQGHQVADETYEGQRLIFRNFAKYDAHGTLTEEEMLSTGDTPFHAIRKHVIEYW
jgi:hypothetical protein